MNRTSRRAAAARPAAGAGRHGMRGWRRHAQTRPRPPQPRRSRPSRSTTEAPTPTTDAGHERRRAGAGITGYGDVQPAVVQIVAQGTFRDPEVGFADGSGLGSGFIISPDGLAVTNNHVVAGAATLEVYIGGELDESYNATILGVSECNDLALIDINGPDDLPYLRVVRRRHRGRPRRLRRRLPARQPRVHADPRHRRQGRGAPATSPARRRSTTPSSTTPASSPATRAARSSTPTGKVVAVNYAGGAMATTTEQFCGDRRPTSPSRSSSSCKTGDFESLGINGWAVYDEALGISGIWVAGVAARFAGRRGGDHARRHRDVDERPARRHRRHVQGLLRRHPHGR